MQITRSLIAYLYIGAVASPFVDFFTNYVFDDVHYLISLCVIMSVDTILGVSRAIMTKTISPKGFGKFFKKFITYASALIMSHVLVTFTIHDKPFIIFSWLDTVIYSAIMVNEAISILENISLITPSLIPEKLIRYFKNFDSFTGKSKDNEKDNSSTNG